METSIVTVSGIKESNITPGSLESEFGTVNNLTTARLGVCWMRSLLNVIKLQEMLFYTYLNSE